MVAAERDPRSRTRRISPFIQIWLFYRPSHAHAAALLPGGLG
jgi:hypothetical protein